MNSSVAEASDIAEA